MIMQVGHRVWEAFSQRHFVKRVQADFPEHYLNMRQRCAECAAVVEVRAYVNERTGLFVCPSCWSIKSVKAVCTIESLEAFLLRSIQGAKEDKDYIYPGAGIWLKHSYKPAYETLLNKWGWVVFCPFTDSIWFEPQEMLRADWCSPRSVASTEDIQSYVAWAEARFPQHPKWFPDEP